MGTRLVYCLMLGNILLQVEPLDTGPVQVTPRVSLKRLGTWLAEMFRAKEVAAMADKECKLGCCQDKRMDRACVGRLI